MAGLVIRPRARILHGHDWVYSSEVLKVFGNPVDGDVISIKDGRDKLLGTAIYNSKSQIVARRYSRRRQDLDLDFFVRRITQAVEWRVNAGCDPLLSRIVWSEADGLPGVVADRYGDVIVLQTLTLGMDQRKDLIVQALAQLPGVATIIERNDAPIRSAEGMELVTGVLFGQDPGDREVTLRGVRFGANFLHGQKTGLYLDQADNYAAVSRFAPGKRVLDCFSNQGGFALACALNGASAVTAVESGAESARRLRENAERNGVTIQTLEADVFEILKDAERAGSQYDLVILDPPSFTKAGRRSRMRSAAITSCISVRLACSLPMACLPPSPVRTTCRPRSLRPPSRAAWATPVGPPVCWPGWDRPRIILLCFICRRPTT